MVSSVSSTVIGDYRPLVVPSVAVRSIGNGAIVMTRVTPNLRHPCRVGSLNRRRKAFIHMTNAAHRTSRPAVQRLAVRNDGQDFSRMRYLKLSMARRSIRTLYTDLAGATGSGTRSPSGIGAIARGRLLR